MSPHTSTTGPWVSSNGSSAAGRVASDACSSRRQLLKTYQPARRRISRVIRHLKTLPVGMKYHSNHSNVATAAKVCRATGMMTDLRISHAAPVFVLTTEPEATDGPPTKYPR
ncbi:hypothetical protein RF11_02381 [Thelohanellus kitauei]|uniref:Uncharacterized protein n=1 Tax=Thelohanellus kitauei TaxID=669202 RepID=A0A0C2IUS3_THEKT|nr:hypothetical protein RF11_02381 [Thelohanellus kitauei]